jgi:signal transduction histidine kinase
LVIDLKYKYQDNIFALTWSNIIAIHTAFVAVMVGVFAYLFYSMQASFISTISDRLEIVYPLGTPEETEIIQAAIDSINYTNTFVLIGLVFFALFCAVVMAQITSSPTKEKMTQQKRFVSSLAHEMRTPLAILRTNNEVALYDLKDAELMKVLNDNIEEIENITNIINNLLIFSGFSSKDSLTFEMVDTEPIIKSVIERLASYAKKHQATIELDVKTTSLVYANTKALEQVFYNLIKNAIIYSKPEGNIVRLTQSIIDNQLVIVLEDKGIGIAEKDLKHIFDPFFKVDGEEIQKSGGNGLGLSMVSDIIKLHTGSINVKSIEGVMTRFTVRLPINYRKS